MPQNAIIRADGTGDYTSDIAWEAAEQSIDYGAVTVGRVDGAITRNNRLTFAGAWPNGGRLEAFSNPFNGNLNDTHPSITSTAGTGFIRNTSASTLEVSGISMVHGGTSGALDCRNNSTARILLNNSYIDAGTTKNIVVLAGGSSFEASGSVLVNTGMVFNAGASSSNVTLTSCSLFGNRNNILLNGGTASSTVIVNDNTGNCFSSVTQTNNASSDATANTLTNIVIADEFVNSDPVTSGDFRISSGSDLDTNTIGAFIQSGGGPTLTADISSEMPSMVSAVTAGILPPSYNVSISSEMPSMASSVTAEKSNPEFDSSISSSMPSMESSASLSYFIQGNSASLSSIMPSMTSAASLTILDPISLDASIDTTMPSMVSSVTASQFVQGNGANIVSVMPSMGSSVNLSHTLPEFDSSIASTMPSMQSSLSLQHTRPINSSSISSVMPSMSSSVSLSITEPVNLSTTITSTMPGMISSATFVNGEVQRIDRVTLSFADNEISVQYNESEINLEYGA